MYTDNTLSQGPCHNQWIDVAIIGGGLGGLACAIALQKEGFCVRVYERDVAFHQRMQGYGLTLTNNKKGPLAQLGLLDECIKEDCPSNFHYVFKPSGEIIGYYGHAFMGAKDDPTNSSIFPSNERGNLRIPRQKLRKMLLDKLEQGTVVWGRRLVDFIELESSVEIHLEAIDSSTVHDSATGAAINCEFPRKETVMASLIVGADGLRSTVRELRDAYLMHYHRIRRSSLSYIGISVIIGLSTARHHLVTKGGFYALDGVHRLFVMPYRSPSSSGLRTAEDSTIDTLTGTDGDDEVTHSLPHLTMWQLSFSGMDEQQALKLRAASAQEKIEEALRRTSGWFFPVRELIIQTALSEVWSTPLYDRDPMPLLLRAGKNKIKSNTKTDSKSLNEQRHDYSAGSTAAASPSLQPLSSSASSSSFSLLAQASSSSTSSSANDCFFSSSSLCCSSASPAALPPSAASVLYVGTRVTVLGDACHPMSMFKGQGCNQALEDGPLLARWLCVGKSLPKNHDKVHGQRGSSFAASRCYNEYDDVDGSGGRNTTKAERMVAGKRKRRDSAITAHLQGVSSVHSVSPTGSVGNAATSYDEKNAEGMCEGLDTSDRTTDNGFASIAASSRPNNNKSNNSNNNNQSRPPAMCLVSLQHLTSAQMCTRLRCFEREMIARTAPKVAASRSAAFFYHSPAAILPGYFTIEGVAVGAKDKSKKMVTGYTLAPPGTTTNNNDLRTPIVSLSSSHVLSRLRELGIGADLGEELEQRMRDVIVQMRCTTDV